MAHISSGVEYGIHCLLYLVTEQSGVSSASVRDLAELQGVSVDFLAKLFTKLRKAGLVAATEGINGGFRLARPAEQISVLDMIQAIDGERALFDCKEIRGRCAVFDGVTPDWATRGLCSIHAVMLEADKRMQESLASHTLAQLAASATAKAPVSYGPQVIRWLDERSAQRRGGASD